MKIIEPTYEILDRNNELPPEKKIESVGRLCYKSEDKITDTSAEPFVKGLIKRHHDAMLEHGVLMIGASEQAYKDIRFLCDEYEDELQTPAFIRHTWCPETRRHVLSGNVRAWRNLIKFSSALYCKYYFPIGFDTFLRAYPVVFGDLEPITTHSRYGNVYSMLPSDLSSKKEKLAHYPLTVKFTVDIAVARELCRHRLASHAGSSTRYCDYSKGKFGSEITVIAPEETVDAEFVRAARYAEEKYMARRNEGKTPEIARSCLTLSTMCEHVMTATLGQWKDIFALRALDSTGKAHPQMKEVMMPLYQECVQMMPEVWSVDSKRD